MRKLFALTIALTTAARIGTLHAESLEEKKYWKTQSDYINEKLASANKACDAKLTFDWVDKDKLRENAEKNKNSSNGVCGSIVDTVESLCRAGADEKAAVKAKITAIQCGYANPRTLDLKGTTLKYMGNNQEANFGDWAKPWLMKHL